MGLIAQFNTALELWFNAHGIPNLNVVEGEDFCFYHGKKNVIQWGVFIQDDIDNNFLQFFDEYGCTLCFSNAFVPSLLHEVGHYLTMPNFSSDEILTEQKQKARTKKKPSIKTNYWYWELPMEFSANLWAIQFINRHIEWIKELTSLCNDFLKKIYEDENIMEQINDWVEDVKMGIDVPLIIDESEDE